MKSGVYILKQFFECRSFGKGNRKIEHLLNTGSFPLYFLLLYPKTFFSILIAQKKLFYINFFMLGRGIKPSIIPDPGN